MTNITNSRVIIDSVTWFCWWPPEKPWAYQAGSHIPLTAQPLEFYFHKFQRVQASWTSNLVAWLLAPGKLTTKKIRLYPVEYKNKIALRAQIVGCVYPEEASPGECHDDEQRLLAIPVTMKYDSDMYVTRFCCALFCDVYRVFFL